MNRNCSSNKPLIDNKSFSDKIPSIRIILIMKHRFLLLKIIVLMEKKLRIQKKKMI